MAEPRLRVYSVVWLDFTADPNVAWPAVPAGRPGAGLVGEFLRWCADQKVYSPVGAGRFAGGGMLSDFYFSNDAERVLQWWQDHGVEPEQADRWAHDAKEGT